MLRKATSAKSKYTVDNFKEVKSQFLGDVVATVELEEIPAQLILNWDQTGIKIIPTSSWTMEKEGSKRIEVVGVDDYCSVLWYTTGWGLPSSSTNLQGQN